MLSKEQARLKSILEKEYWLKIDQARLIYSEKRRAMEEELSNAEVCEFEIYQKKLKEIPGMIVQ